MNGLYNTLFGANPAATVILRTLDLSMETVPRFRDVHISDGKIAVYTRMGGGNRGHWESTEPDQPPGPDCLCPGCRAQLLARHEHYLYDRDDDFDSTYATYYFRFPPMFAEGLTALDTGDIWNPDERWQAMLEALESTTKR